MSAASDAVHVDDLPVKLAARLGEMWERCRLAGDAAPYTVRPALTEEELVELEAQLGGRLPAVIKASLLISGGVDWKCDWRRARYPLLKPGSAEVVTGADLRSRCGELRLDVEAAARFVVIMHHSQPGCVTTLLGELSSGRLLRMTYVDNLADSPGVTLEDEGAGGWLSLIRGLSLTT